MELVKDLPLELRTVPPGDIKTCMDCGYYKASDVRTGVCHANPPVAVPTAQGQMMLRPVVKMDDKLCRFFK